MDQTENIKAILEKTFKYLEINKDITIDNWIFRSVTAFSFDLLVACAIIGGFTSYFGDPIVCEEKGGHRIELIEAHCWLHGTRDLEDKLGLQGVNCTKGGDKLSRNLYYEWVVLVLFLSAILLKIPALFWSWIEGGLMSTFSGQYKDMEILKQGKRDFKQAVETEATNFKKIQESFSTNFYYTKFLFCQFVAWGLLVGVFFMNDRFLEYNFVSYGHNVIEFWKKSEPERSEDVNPMCQAFPTKVGCEVILKNHTTGKEEVTDAVCILRHNIVNEKIYLVLWFWFVIMFAVSGFQLILEIFFVTLPYYFLRLQFFIFQAIKYKIMSTDMKKYLATCSVGDVFVLYQISKNTNSNFFNELLEYLSKSDQPDQPVQPDTCPA